MNSFPFIPTFKIELLLAGALLWLAALTMFAQKPEVYVSTGHSGSINTVAFSPDGRTLATGSDDNTIRLWDVRSGQELKTLKGHSNDVNSVVFSPDGKTLASGSSDKTIKLWDAVSGQELKTLEGHATSVSSVAFSPDGKMLASGSDNSLVLYSRNGKISYSPNGKTLSSSTIKLWDVASGQELKFFKGHSTSISSVAFSSDGKTLASGGSDRTIRMWDTASGHELKTLSGHSNSVMSIAFSADGKTLASGSVDNTVKLWDSASGQELRTLRGHLSYVSSVAFSPDGKTLASGSADPIVKLWDVSTGRELKTLKGFLTTVVSLAFSPDGMTLALANKDTTIKIWDIASEREIRTLKSHSSPVDLVAFSPDGKTLAGGTQDNTVKLWDLETGQTLKTLKGHSKHILSIAFSSDGKMLLTGSEDSTIKLWDVASAQELRTLEASTSVVSVTFITEYNMIASVDRGAKIKLWNVVSGQELKTSNNSELQVASEVAFSPDGKTLALFCWGGVNKGQSLRLLDVASGKELESIKINSAVRTLAFSPDGKILAGGGYDATIKLWNVASGQELKTLKASSRGVNSLAFSPDGTTFVSGTYDATLELWNVASGQMIKTLKGHSNIVNSVAFSPDGETLVSGSADATVKLWDVISGNKLATLITLDEKDWVVITPDGRFDGSPDGMKLISYKQDDKLIPLDSFFEQFYTPKLLQKVYAREKLPATTSKVDFSKQIKLPPVVRITSPKPGDGSESDTAQIVVEAHDQGGGVEDIRLYQNGKLLGHTTRQLTVETKTNTKTFEVSLVSGINTFRATAFNKDRTEATPDEVKIELKAAEPTADLYILAVGLNEYKNTNYNLNYGRADAQAFADVVEQRGQKIFKHISKKVIFDANATNGGIEAAFGEIIKQAKARDVFVFYYAGHGAMSEGDDKTAADFYLVPYDVVRIFGDSGSLTTKGISAHDLREMLRKVQALKQLIVIDACESGGAVETIAMRGPSEEKAIAQLARSAGVAVLASAGQSQVATEFAKLGHGVFTYALLKGLNGEADGSPKDGKVTVLELAAYLNEQVPELTKLYRGKRQDPNSSTRGQDFPIGIN